VATGQSANALKVMTVALIFVSYSHSTSVFFLRKTKLSKMLSVKWVRFLFIVRPAQLNKRSTAALAGKGVLKRMNNSFRAG
jgi:hypothetical protein